MVSMTAFMSVVLQSARLPQAARVAHAPPAAIKSPVPAHAATRTPAFPAVDPIPEQDIWEFNDDDSDVDAPKQSHVVEARAPAKEQTEPTQV